MNKYQEALNKLKELGLSIPANGQGEEFGFSQDFDFDHDGYESECSLMQELVDKEIPMKPALLISHKKPNKRQYQCLRCGNACLVRYAPFERNENKHCYDCGQAIDWSDNEA